MCGGCVMSVDVCGCVCSVNAWARVETGNVM